MADTDDQIKRIAEKLGVVSSRLKTLQKENEKIRKALEEKKLECDAIKDAAKQMELNLNVMKSTESVDSKETRAALEKKINDYIKEIDRCIALLGNEG
jgi:predicted  nucleic acid-binding Zn-ribbon protein